MIVRRSILRFLVFSTILMLSYANTAQAKTKAIKDHRLNLAIARVRSTESAKLRHTRAEHLLALTDERDCSRVTDATLHSLVSLLEIDDDEVQMWVAAAIGEFGPRAQFAAPRLIAILAVSDCQMWDHSSASTIPVALRNIGVQIPSRNCPNL